MSLSRPSGVRGERVARWAGYNGGFDERATPVYNQFMQKATQSTLLGYHYLFTIVCEVTENTFLNHLAIGRLSDNL